MIQVDGNGELHLRTSPDRNGVVLVGIELVDDGGTAMGGYDSSQQNVTLVVTAVNTHPDFVLPPSGLTAVCSEGSASLYMPNVIHTVPFPIDEREQQTTFHILHNSDETLFSGPFGVENDGSVSFACASESAGVAAIEMMLEDDGGSRTAGARAPVQAICSSTDAVAPSCEVLVQGLGIWPVRPHDQPYSGFQIRVSVANSDFSDEDEFVSAVWIGNKMFDGLHDGDGSIRARRFMSDGRTGGHDNMCGKKDTILDTWLPAESELFVQGPEPEHRQLRIRIETSEAVGCCYCHGATLYAEISITPYLVPDMLSLRQTLNVWVVPQVYAASMRVPPALSLVEQLCASSGSTHAIVRIQHWSLILDSGVKLADQVWSIQVSVQHATNSRLFSAEPSIMGSGVPGGGWELSIPLGCEQIGNADLVFTASVQVSRANFVTQVFETPAQRCALSVRPRPRIVRVEPCFGSVRGSSLVTVHGYHLAPLSASDALSISFNGRPCGQVAVLSSEAATCITPAAEDVWNATSTVSHTVAQSHDAPVNPRTGRQLHDAGYVNVSVMLADTGRAAADNRSLAARYHGDDLRVDTLPHAFRYVMLLIAATEYAFEQSTAGLLGALSPKYLALGPVPMTTLVNTSSGNGKAAFRARTPATYYPSESARTIWDTGVRTSGGMTALVIWRHRLVVAGTFGTQAPRINGFQDKRLSDKAHRIFTWDGASLGPLALGLDGPVHALATFSSLLIVGGSFFRALQADGSVELKSGILAVSVILALYPLVRARVLVRARPPRISLKARKKGLDTSACACSECSGRWLGIMGWQPLGQGGRRSPGWVCDHVSCCPWPPLHRW